MRVKKYPQLELPLVVPPVPMKEEKQMAKKTKVVKKVEKKKGGRPVGNKDEAAAKKSGVPLVVHVPRKLRGLAKLAATAAGDSLSTVIRGMLKDYIKSQQKALAKMASDFSKGIDDEDEDEVEDTDTDTDVAEDEDEEEEEEDEEEEEEEDEDEDEE